MYFFILNSLSVSCLLSLCFLIIDQLERVFMRLGHAETDEQLQDIISKFLPPVLLKLSSVQEGVRKKVSVCEKAVFLPTIVLFCYLLMYYIYLFILV